MSTRYTLYHSEDLHIHTDCIEEPTVVCVETYQPKVVITMPWSAAVEVAKFVNTVVDESEASR